MSSDDNAMGETVRRELIIPAYSFSFVCVLVGIQTREPLYTLLGCLLAIGAGAHSHTLQTETERSENTRD